MESNSVETIGLIKTSCFFYDQIPSSLIRNSVDSWFPAFSKNSLADIPPFGKYHRYREGHDLLIDVPNTLINHGPSSALKHLGHILLTDFPTKAGIPIPGFSKSGLGQMLTEFGITRGWLTISLHEGGIGILAVAEGYSDLQAALSGKLEMSATVFFDTFVEGPLEVYIGVTRGSGLLMIAGIENILAGLVSTWKTISVYVEPMAFFGGVCSSMLVGGVIGYSIFNKEPLHERLSHSLMVSYRSGLLSAFFTVQSAFGFGALLVLGTLEYSKKLAFHKNKNQNAIFKCSQKTFEMLMAAYVENSPLFQEILDSCMIEVLVPADQPNMINTQSNHLLVSDLIIDVETKGSLKLKSSIDINLRNTISSFIDGDFHFALKPGES